MKQGVSTINVFFVQKHISSWKTSFTDCFSLNILCNYKAFLTCKQKYLTAAQA